MSEIGPPPLEGRIRVERRGALMLIGIDRPVKLNGFTPEMIDQLS
jgi:enoyl-CoA hydratase